LLLRWRVLQIADSSFPTGGFAHSSGLEAAVQRGFVRDVGDLADYIDALLWSTGRVMLPFVGAAFDAPDALRSVGAHLDAFLSNHVQKRASLTQGRAFIATCERIFDHPRIAEWAECVRKREAPAHLAPLFGATFAALDLERVETLGVFLHYALRGGLSAAVRLGVLGPHEAQRMHGAAIPTLDAVLSACAATAPDAAANTAPIFDIVAATHDELYARMFQS
jgi:urease accessory protein